MSSMKAIARAVALLALIGSATAQDLGDAALKAAVQSECGRHEWVKRGQAPAGYVKGMAQSYATAWCQARKDPASVSAFLAETTFDPSRDALAHYGKAGGTADDRLRALYALAIGEGMRESSGDTTEGWDKSVTSGQTAEKAETGLFQVSHDSINDSPWLRKLWDRYSAAPASCRLAVFMEGVKDQQRPEFGAGAAAEFQAFTKRCPAFAVEYAMVMFRVKRSHFGPIVRKEAELLPACVAMLEEVEKVAAPACP